MNVSDIKTDSNPTKPVKRGQEKVLIHDTDMDDDMLITAIDIVEKNYISNISNDSRNCK